MELDVEIKSVEEKGERTLRKRGAVAISVITTPQQCSAWCLHNRLATFVVFTEIAAATSAWSRGVVSPIPHFPWTLYCHQKTTDEEQELAEVEAAGLTPALHLHPL